MATLAATRPGILDDMRVTLDVQEIDAFMNDPSVYPLIGGDGRPVTAQHCLGAQHIWLTSGEALMCFHQEDRGWHKHNLFKAGCRGAAAIAMGKSMLGWFFANVAPELKAETPLQNKAARWFNRQIGFRSVGFRDHEIVGPVECFLCQL